MDAVTEVGHALLRGISLALGLDDGLVRSASHRRRRRCCSASSATRRSPAPSKRTQEWSVGEHTDYGLLTILAQDAVGGLEVRSRDGWVAAPPIPDAFVVNLGDMLERMTGGRYRSTPHRVRNTSARDRLSFPLFLDPAWDAEVLPVPNVAGRDAERDREAATSTVGTA